MSKTPFTFNSTIAEDQLKELVISGFAQETGLRISNVKFNIRPKERDMRDEPMGHTVEAIVTLSTEGRTR